MQPTLLTNKEAADYLRVAPHTLDNWRYESSGPPYLKLGRKVLYRQGDLDAFLEANYVGGATS